MNKIIGKIFLKRSNKPIALLIKTSIQCTVHAYQMVVVI